MTTEGGTTPPRAAEKDRRAPAWIRLVLGGLLIAAPIIFVPLSPYFLDSAPNAVITLATFAAIFAVLAYAIGTLMRFLDLPSGGHAGLFGVGAYASGLAMTDLGLGFWPALLVAVIVAAVVGIGMGALSLRTSGLAFLIITIALGSLLVLVLDNWEGLTGGPIGLFLFDRPELIPGISLDGQLARYYTALGFVFVAAGIVWLVASSRFGERLTAIRDNEPLARSLGINTFGQKLLAFVLTAAIAGAAGHLYMISLKAITPDLFVAIGLISVFLMVVMGGQGTLAGPAVGAWFVTFLPEWFEPLGLDDPTRQEFVFGALLILFMLLAPIGIMGGLSAVVDRTVRRGRPVRDRVPLPLSPSRLSILSLQRRRAPADAAPGDGDAFFEVRDIGKSFGAVQALDGVSLDVRPGEIVGIIGPNGSGKTTLLNCVSGMLRADRGSVAWKGEDITRLRPDLIAQLGIVRTFQETMSFPELSPREHIELIWRPGGPTRIGGIDSREDVLELFDLDAYADTPAADLSYGQISGLGVATAVATGLPELIMLDEPAAGLSNVESGRLRDRLRDLRDRGLTVVVVDHDMPFLMPMCDRVIVLDAGEKIAEGTPIEVQQNPKVVAAYLGERFAEEAETGAPVKRRRKPAVATSAAATGASGGHEQRDLLVEQVDAGYGNLKVLSDVSLRVGAGEAVALLGANGAGKTTFLRALSGLIEPTSGMFSYGDDELNGLTPPAILRRGIAHVPQGRQVFPDQTVEENLLLGARLRRDRTGVAEDREYILSVFPALGGKLKQAAGDLSGGQQQSLAIARALMSDPSLILLDEPSLGLAPNLIDDMAELLTKIREDRQTGMLLVEQDAMLALELTDRTYVLQRGSIMMERDSEDLVGDPSVVLAYLGSEDEPGEPLRAGSGGEA